VWLSQSSSHRAVLIATGLAHDAEIGERIARHQADRLMRLPALRCVEESAQLGAALRSASDAQTLVVIDCLTMWLTNLLMPTEQLVSQGNRALAGMNAAQSAIDLIVDLKRALANTSGPVVLVSNEIGLGVIPLGQGVRQFVDELGQLNQAMAASCERVTLMAAGCALTIKGAV
jgi:adenosylcobinamide kinase / adenosylcobinamide-phosphate guanylyltransferase